MLRVWLFALHLTKRSKVCCKPSYLRMSSSVALVQRRWHSVVSFTGRIGQNVINRSYELVRWGRMRFGEDVGEGGMGMEKMGG